MRNLEPEDWLLLGDTYKGLPSKHFSDALDTHAEAYGIGFFIDAVTQDARERGMDADMAYEVAAGAVRGVLASKRLLEERMPE